MYGHRASVSVLTEVWGPRLRDKAGSGGAPMRRGQRALQNTTGPPRDRLVPDPISKPRLPECVCLVTAGLCKGPEKFFWDEIKRTFYKNS